MKNKRIYKREVIILLNFLKSSFSTRKLDELLGLDKEKSKGYPSWEILKKYNIENNDKGRLFCFREQECVSIIKKIIDCKSRTEVQKIFGNSQPKHLENYRNTYIIADNGKKVYFVLQGEVRNITQGFFNPLKKIIGKCEFSNCNNTNLDTVHLKKSRPEIFELACKSGYLPSSNKYDVYKIIWQYIQLHEKKNSFCFLCKKHHQELHVHEKEGGLKLINFKKNIKNH